MQERFEADVETDAYFARECGQLQKSDVGNGLIRPRSDAHRQWLLLHFGEVSLLTNLFTRYPPMPPKLNRKRALFVLTKIDEILAWEKRYEAERDTRFVELGRYLCEVRAGQYRRLENLKSFDEFLERRFPESRRKAYYLMSIHEHLPPQARRGLKEVGWTKGLELAKLARRDGQHFDCATWLHKARARQRKTLGGRWRRNRRGRK